MTSAPAKPAQPTITDLYAEIDALRKEREVLQNALGIAVNKAKAEAFDLKQPSIHDDGATLTAGANGVTVTATRDGVAIASSEIPTISVARRAAPFSNFQAAAFAVHHATGIDLGEPQLASAARPATVASDATA